jgi:O-antigen/teichoic acid export membrane protein
MRRILKKTVLRNAAAIYGGEALSRSVTLVTALIVARRFSPAALGQYGYAVAIVSVFVLLPDLGLHLVVTREVAAEHGSLPEAFWNLHWLKLILAGLVSIAGVSFGLLALHEAGQRWMFFLLAGRALLQSFSMGCMAIFKAMERMHFVTLLQFGNGIVTGAGLTACVILKAGLYTTVSALLWGQIVETVLGGWMIYWYFNPGPARAWDSRRLFIMFITAVPIGLTALLQAFGLRLDILILGFYSVNEQLGQFQAASIIVIAGFIVTSLLMTVLFPKLVRVLQNSASAGAVYLESLIKHGTLAATFVSILVWIAAPNLVMLFFGQNLRPAVSIMRILAPILPFVFINTTMFFVFVALNRRRAYLATLAATVGLGIGLSFFMAPRLGGAGVGLADLIREGVGSVIYVYILGRGARVPVLGVALLKIFLSTGAFVFVAALVAGVAGNLHLWAVMGSLIMFGEMLLLTGIPRREQITLLANEDL